MKAEQKVIVNCGASHVSLTIFTVGEEELVLENSYSESLHYDFSDDFQWLESVMEALSNITKKHKISGKTHFILPGFLLLTKTIRVPRVEEHKQQQIIEFEAQQNIPYPLSDVVWDSHIVSEDDIDNEALLIAIKKDIAKNFCSRVNEMGLFPVSMGASSILDVNALHLAGYDTQDSENLIINIGSRSTNLLFINPTGFLIRTINVGGNTLTQNISDNLGLAFEQAEELKVQYFSGELEADENEPAVHVLQQAADVFFKRLNQEITRSIVTYKRQKKGKSPTHIYLTGKASLLSGLSDFIAEKQRVTVEYFQCLSPITMGKKVDSDEMAMRQLNLTEVVGAVARDYVEHPVGVNLLPGEFLATQDFKKRKPVLVIAAILLSLIPFGPYYFKTQEIAKKTQFKQLLLSEIPPLRDYRDAIEENKMIAETYSEAVNKISRVVENRYNWNQLFTNFQSILLEIKDVWLDDLDITRSNISGKDPVSYLNIKGRLLVRKEKDPVTGEFKPIDQNILAERIGLLKSVLVASDFINKEKVSKIDFQALKAGLNLLPFEITLEINPEKPL